MTRRDDRAVMLVIEGRAAEVNQSNVGVFDTSDFAILMEGKIIRNERDLKGFFYLSSIEGRRVIGSYKQNIFRLQIGVREFVLVQELH